MKGKYRYLIIVAILFIVTIINYLWYNSALEMQSVEVFGKNGQLMLSEWDEKNLVILGGEWLYFDSQLKEDLSSSDKGTIAIIPEYKKGNKLDNFYRYGTYQLTLTGLSPSSPYGLYSREQVSAYQLYANDIPVLSDGKVGRSLETYIPYWSEQSTIIYSDNEGVIDLKLEISNFLYDDGIFWNALRLGTPNEIFAYHSNQITVEVILIIAFLVIALLFLILFFFFDLSHSLLFFSLFIVVIAIRLMFTSSRVIVHFTHFFDWNSVVRIEYLTGFLLAPSICLLILSLISSKYLKATGYISIIYTIVIGGITLFAPHHVYTQLLNPYLYGSLILIFILLMGILFFFRKNIFYEAVLILSFSNIIIAIYHQLFGNLVSWAPIAIFNVVIGFSIIQFDEFLHYIKEKEIQAINAAIDPLTGLYNRQYLNGFNINHLKDKSLYKDHFVMFLDIDSFKNINDKHGHEIGDAVLQFIGQRIRSHFQRDDVIFRYGGDEFIVIINCNTLVEIEEIAWNLIQILNEPFFYKGLELKIGASIGIVKYDKQGHKSLEECIHLSDKEMYKAKKSGGNAFSIG